jgi:hypothetical protein
MSPCPGPNGYLNRKRVRFQTANESDYWPATAIGPTAFETSLAFSGSVGKNLRQILEK